jgi:TrmH family RNA methyltransferase
MADDVIRSASNPLVHKLRSLKEKGDRELCLLEGPTLVEEALAAGIEVVEAALSSRFARTHRGRRLMGALSRARLLDERLISSLSEVETSQGVLALARRPRFEEQAFFPDEPLIVVAVGLQNPGNLGGLLRTAEAAGATGAYLAEGTADSFSWKALRGSMGSAFRLPHLRHAAAGEVLASLRARSIRIIATVSGSGGVRYETADLARPAALFFGNEGSGLPEDIEAGADLRVSIPLLGPVESLNVGVAAGVILFEAARQRRRGDRLRK